jgi:hypothetical protein
LTKREWHHIERKEIKEYCVLYKTDSSECRTSVFFLIFEFTYTDYIPRNSESGGTFVPGNLRSHMMIYLCVFEHDGISIPLTDIK